MAWLRNKFGRIMAFLGGLVALVDFVPPDLSPVAEYLKDLIGHRAVSAVMFACFVMSFARHQQIANRVKKLEAQGGELPK